jgi:hypothetical protein
LICVELESEHHNMFSLGKSNCAWSLAPQGSHNEARMVGLSWRVCAAAGLLLAQCWSAVADDGLVVELDIEKHQVRIFGHQLPVTDWSVSSLHRRRL